MIRGSCPEKAKLQMTPKTVKMMMGLVKTPLETYGRTYSIMKKAVK